MIQLTPQHRLFIYRKAIDFRKGIDSLVGLCRSQLAEDPFSGTVFVFINRTHTAVKLLVYDGNGFWLMHKRFSKGRLKRWPAQQDEPVCALSLMIMLNQGHTDLTSSSWRALSTDSKVA